MSQATLRTILDNAKRSGLDVEQLMDMPLSIGVSDDYRHFDIATVYSDYQGFKVFMPHESFKGQIRIECYLTNKRLVENKKK